MAANGGDELEVGIKHLNTVVAEISDEKTILLVDGDLERHELKCALSAPLLFSVPMRCCTLPSWSKINTWWSVPIADKHLAAAVEQTCCGYFSTSWPKERTKPSETSNTHTRLLLASHRQKDCQLRRRRLHVDSRSVFHRCQRHRFLQECGAARHCRRQTPAHGGCTSQQRKDETGGRQPHPKV